MSGLTKHSITSKIIGITIIPLFVLSVFLSTFAAVSSYNSANSEIYHELESLCHCIYEFVAASDQGIYSCNVEIFDEIRGNTGIDITIFEGDTRLITTVKDDDGSRIVGTRAAQDVISEVINGGQNYFSDNVEVNGMRYFGYYMPISDESSNVTGMTFAGKSRANVDSKIAGVIMRAMGISWFAAATVGALCIFVSNRMARSLRSVTGLIREISLGNVDAVPDKKVISRTDEIGEIARSAVTLRNELKKLIFTDPLTGLLNRRACNKKLSEFKENADSLGHEFVVSIGDIDLFKSFNDNYGHACGDEVLKDISGILQSVVGDKGAVSRWGGEEFLLVFGGIPYDEALETIKSVMSEIHAYRCRFDGMELPVTMTFGIERYTGGITVDSLVSRADNKLYFGKNHGRNRIVDVMPENEAQGQYQA